MQEVNKEKKNNAHRKRTETENEWIEPKKGMTMKGVCEMQGTTENKKDDYGKHKELMCDEEKDEDDECHTVFKIPKAIRCQIRRNVAMV